MSEWRWRGSTGLPVHPGFWPFPDPESQLPKGCLGRPRVSLSDHFWANTEPTGPRTTHQNKHSKQAIFLTSGQRNMQPVRGCRLQGSWSAVQRPSWLWSSSIGEEGKDSLLGRPLLVAPCAHLGLSTAVGQARGGWGQASAMWRGAQSRDSCPGEGFQRRAGQIPLATPQDGRSHSQFSAVPSRDPTALTFCALQARARHPWRPLWAQKALRGSSLPRATRGGGQGENEDCVTGGRHLSWGGTRVSASPYEPSSSLPRFESAPPNPGRGRPARVSMWRSVGPEAGQTWAFGPLSGF